MDILQKIKEQKEYEVSSLRKLLPESTLRSMEHFNSETICLSSKLLKSGRPSFIAEFKRKSPSKGWINVLADPVAVTTAYENAGASAISVLTDQPFFGAREEDFTNVRKAVCLPILRKDFIIDHYQVTETKAMGADILLLIASILSQQQIDELSSYARELGLEVLLEVHNRKEAEYVPSGITMIGINNRNLRNFEVNVENSLDLKERLPNHLPAIAESGISDIGQVDKLFAAGFKGFLIGEKFMKTEDPGAACSEFIKPYRDANE